MRCSLTLALAAFLTLASASNASEPFPVPAALEPNVAFWTRIYSEVSSSDGLIHDSRHLDVVYETIELPRTLSRRASERRLKRRKEHYISILRKLAAGERKNLDAEQRRVLALWPADVSSKTLKQAARRVRFQRGLSERFRDGVIRSGQWETHIQQVLAERGLPPELAALPHVESSYDPTVSPMRAPPACGSSRDLRDAASCGSIPSWTSASIPTSPRWPRRGCWPRTSSAPARGRSPSRPTTTARVAWCARCDSSARETSAASHDSLSTRVLATATSIQASEPEAIARGKVRERDGKRVVIRCRPPADPVGDVVQCAAVKPYILQYSVVQLPQCQIGRPADVPPLKHLGELLQDGATRRGSLEDLRIVGNLDATGAGDAANEDIQHG